MDESRWMREGGRERKLEGREERIQTLLKVRIIQKDETMMTSSSVCY